MIGFSLLLCACDGRFPWESAPRTDSNQPLAAARLALTPDELVLNVPSLDPCPCPYESTGSLRADGAAGLSVTWQVADGAVAKVGADGLVTAVATGTTVLTLEAGTQRATASVVVLDRGGRAAVVVH